MHTLVWTPASIKSHQSELKSVIRSLIPLKETSFKEAFASALGFNTENALIAALKAHGQIEAYFDKVAFTKRLRELSNNDTSMVVSELLEGAQLDISVVKRSQSRQGNHSDVAYDVEVTLSNVAPDILKREIIFHLPEFGKSGLEPYRVDSNFDYRAKVDYKKTRFGLGQATTIATLKNGKWQGGFFIYESEHQMNDIRCVASLKAALARAVLLKIPTSVRCEIFKPDGYDNEVWRVEMSIPPSVEHYMGDTPLRFDIPNLNKRFFLLNGSYVPNPFEGQFQNGVWKTDFTSNGIAEEKNPTSLQVVKQALLDAVNKAIKLSEYQKEGEFIPVIDSDGKMAGTIQYKKGIYEAWKRSRLVGKPGNSHTPLGNFGGINAARNAVLQNPQQS